MPHLPRHEGYGALMKKIAKSTQLQTQDVKAVLYHAWTFAYAEVKKNKEVRIPGFEPLKLKHKPARKTGTNVMFGGNKVKVAAKPASKVVKALPLSKTRSAPPEPIDFS